MLTGGTALGAAAGIAPRSADAAVRIDITQGNPQPMPIALPDFVTGSPRETETAHNLTEVITNNLRRSGLFAPINPQAFTERITNFDAVPRFADWRGVLAEPAPPDAQRNSCTKPYQVYPYFGVCGTQDLLHHSLLQSSRTSIGSIDVRISQLTPGAAAEQQSAPTPVRVV
jgi:hypothetical protein